MQNGNGAKGDKCNNLHLKSDVAKSCMLIFAFVCNAHLTSKNKTRVMPESQGYQYFQKYGPTGFLLIFGMGIAYCICVCQRGGTAFDKRIRISN